jgi:hypothetical protein
MFISMALAYLLVSGVFYFAWQIDLGPGEILLASFIAFAYFRGDLIRTAAEPVTEMLQTISSEEVAALRDAHLTVPEDRDFRTSRAKFRESGRGERRPLPPRRWVWTIDGVAFGWLKDRASGF